MKRRGRHRCTGRLRSLGHRLSRRLAPKRFFLFVGDVGNALGGMQDYYGAYGRLPSALRAVPSEVNWAEVAVVRHGRLEVVAMGERDDHHGHGWRWAFDADSRSGERDGAAA